MSKHCSIILTLMVATAAPSAHAGWESKPSSQQEEGNGKYVLVYNQDPNKGRGSIREAIEDLLKRGPDCRLGALSSLDILKDEVFQKELMEQMGKLAPQELDAAKRSAGNMHNPRMIALRQYFSNAVIATPTVVSIGKYLSMSGRKVSRIEFEKLELQKKDQKHEFTCMMWFIIEPIALPSKTGGAEKSGESSSGKSS